MHGQVATCAVLASVLALFSGCGDAATQTSQPAAEGESVPGTVLVAVASNFVPALKQLQPRFEAATGHRLSMSVGSTGKLYAQIHAGAPYDVLLAADQERPLLLEQEGRTVERFAYAEGRLVLWHARANAETTDAPLELLRAGRFSRLVMANPKLAPYGAAAESTLNTLGLSEGVADRLVFGENLGQAHAMLATGNAELGFTALAYLRATPSQQPQRFWEVPAALHEPIRQEAVWLRRAEDNLAAAAFMTFLRSAPATSVIAAAGYGLPPDYACTL